MSLNATIPITYVPNADKADGKPVSWALIQNNGVDVTPRSYLNFVSGVTITDDAANNRINFTFSGGSGTVTGPGSSTDTAIALWDGTTGALLKNSAVTVDSSGNVTLAGSSYRILSSVDNNTVSMIGGTSKTNAAYIEASGDSHATTPGDVGVRIKGTGAFKVTRAALGSLTNTEVYSLVYNTGFTYSSNTTGQLGILQQASADSSAYTFSFRKARGTIGGESAISNGDELGNILFRGYSGAAGYVTGASIVAASTGTIATNQVPGTLTFRTANSSGTLTTALTLDSSQVATFSGGVIGSYFRASNFYTYQTLEGLTNISGGCALMTSGSAHIGVSNIGGAIVRILTQFGLTSSMVVTPDVVLVRDTAAVLALRNGANAQTFRVYNTESSSLANYARCVIDTTGATSLLRTEAAGTGLSSGQPRILQLGTGPSVGTNIAGQNTIIASGQPTGNAAPGAILFQQGLPAGGSGSSNTALATIWQISTDGHFVNSGTFRIGVGIAAPEFSIHAVKSDGLISGLVSTQSLSTTSGAGSFLYAFALPTGADQRLGLFGFGSKNGTTATHHGAAVSAFSEGAWTAAISHPTYLALETCPSGSTTRVERLRIGATGLLTVWDGGNFAIGTTTGTKIGTATGQKLGFWDATPVVQQVLATGGGATVDNVISLLQTLGLCKQA